MEAFDMDYEDFGDELPNSMEQIDEDLELGEAGRGWVRPPVEEMDAATTSLGEAPRFTDHERFVHSCGMHADKRLVLWVLAYMCSYTQRKSACTCRPQRP